MAGHRGRLFQPKEIEQRRRDVGQPSVSDPVY
jgi:hypothetical protein